MFSKDTYWQQLILYSIPTLLQPIKRLLGIINNTLSAKTADTKFQSFTSTPVMCWMDMQTAPCYFHSISRQIRSYFCGGIHRHLLSPFGAFTLHIIFLSKTRKRFSSDLLIIHISDSYARNGLIRILYSSILVFLIKCRF